MTITISKSKLAVAIVAVAMLIPSSAMAFHVFDDVPDDKFYADPVEWAFDNGITTGKTATTFAPDDNVTRGESVTFLNRYHENLVEPALAIGPVGYATVLDDGSVDASHSSGVTDANVDLEATSAFCFYDLPFDFTVAQVTARYEGEEQTSTVEVGYPGGTDGGVLDCSAGAVLEIATLEAGSWAPHGFTVVFFG